MSRRFAVVSLVVALCAVRVAMAQEPAAPRIISWSNSKTGDKKTVFQVKPGEKITFTVKADGAEKYQWLGNNAVQNEAKGASFTWTVPAKKGIWKILVKTTNKAREQWVAEHAAFWEKWVKVTKDRRGMAHPEKKRAFIRGMIDNRLYPLKSRKEWIVSTFLVRVKPGQSIQKAIDSLPPEGGIVELAAGVHEINDTLYPPGDFHRVYKKLSRRYSILIKRSNVAICGTRRSIVRDHNKSAHCFLLPDLEATDPNLYVENITFRGFTTASTYKKGSALIRASHVKNLTIEGINNTASAALLGMGSDQGHRRYSENVFVRDNLNSTMFVQHIRNIHVIGNTLRGSIGTDERLSNMYVIGNHLTVTKRSSNRALLVDAPKYCLVSDNFVRGSQASIRITQHGYQIMVENNVFTEATRHAILLITQSPMRNVLIRNNLIYNNKKDGIFTRQYTNPSGEAGVTITNNIIWNNGRDGIRTGTKHIALNVSNNIIANNKGYGINDAAGKVRLSHNDVWNNAKGNYKGYAAGKGDFSKDPLFANPLKGDFHLKSKVGRWDPRAKKWIKDNVHSPCIDAGDPKADFSREPAPNGGRVNMGAYGNTREASKSTVQQNRQKG